MLGELKTSLLDPENYFTLFIQIFTQMRNLEKFFKEEHERGRKLK